MCRYNDCEKCPYFEFWVEYWSGEPRENCKAGLNPEEGCKHNRLVRWILYKIQQRKDKKYEEYMMSLLEPEEGTEDERRA